jgi:3,8-divinyl chlorophyllide a/chlorophyllide a reductase subunit Y
MWARLPGHTVECDHDAEWLRSKGVQVQFRASLEQRPGRHARVPAATGHRHHAGGAGREGASIPSLYFTNLISARPLMGPQVPVH